MPGRKGGEEVDYQIKLDGEIDLLDAKKRLRKIKEERKQEERDKQLNLFPEGD